MIQVKTTPGRYVDINTDFGWKLYFGREENKELLIKFMNDVFQGEHIIQDLQYLAIEDEHNGLVMMELDGVTKNGDHILIGIQLTYDEDAYKKRSLISSSKLITNQYLKDSVGDEDDFAALYFIDILMFPLTDICDDHYFQDVALVDKSLDQVFNDKLGFKVLILPHFNKKEHVLFNDLEHWLYLFKNLGEMQKQSDYLTDKIFKHIFAIGEINSLSKEDQQSYAESLQRKSDWEQIIASTQRIGREEAMNKIMADNMRYEAKLKRKWDWESIISTAQRLAREEGLQHGIQKGNE